MRFRLLISVVIFLCHGCSYSDAGDTIKEGGYISFGETVLSAGEKYALGFIELNEGSKLYLGIWYKADEHGSPVWIANRDCPVSSSASFTLTGEGNMVIFDGKITYMVANTSAGPGTQARLLDSGNLIVQNGELELFWQSFDNPTNTLLPGMSIGGYPGTPSFKYLQSWKSARDPSPGNFLLLLDYTTKLFIYNITTQHWVGHPNLDNLTTPYWVGDLSQYIGSNFSWPGNRVDTYYITWFQSDSSEISKLVLDSDGQLVRKSWSKSSHNWILSNSSKCGPGSCGSNSICNVSSSPEQERCCCLQGFNRAVRDANLGGNVSDCVRPTNISCDPKDVGFLEYSDVVLKANMINETHATVEACQSSCRENCFCSGFFFRAIERLCLIWTGEPLNMQTTSDVESNKVDFNLKILLSEKNPGSTQERDDGNKNNNKRDKIQVLVIAFLTCSLTLFALVLLLYYARKRLLRKVGEDLLLFDLNTTPKDDESEFSETYGKERSNEVKMPLFSFSSVSAATDNFSDENKLGEGGFGPVYKGKTLKGNEIAVKRLSQKSRQGWEELKNEALLIAKLQHKNLVRLLGCCIEGDEKILIYEYMPNKSLDYFLFDPDRRKILDWGRRVQIIEGIAQGLLYLHEYSRFRIVHRDLKVSNILLDADMNPKIADFGMARMFGGDESEANTNRIVGTFGYMPPEYALEGTYSTKSDVFSFGVLLLEIVSGRKNTGFYSNKDSNLLGHAWDLWTNEKGHNLIDPDLKEVSSSLVGLRYVNIGLLCVQDSPDDRPSMSNVVSMLGNEAIPLSQPNQPGFLNMRSGATSSSKSQVTNDVTPVGMWDPR